MDPTPKPRKRFDNHILALEQTYSATILAENNQIAGIFEDNVMTVDQFFNN